MLLPICVRAALALIVLCATSCTTLNPLPIAEPTKLGQAVPSRGLPPPKTLDDAKATLYAYANAYTDRSEKLLSDGYSASNWTLGGGLLGMIGGLTKSPEAALVGAGMAGGSGVFSQRYSLQVQSSNYLGAAHAMECMATVLVYGKAGDGTEAERGMAPAPIIDADVDLPYLNDRINDVRRKLRANQASIDISRVDITSVESALQGHIDAKRAREAAKKAKDKAVAEKNVLEEQSNSLRGLKVDDPAMKAFADQMVKVNLDLAAAQRAINEANREIVRKALAACASTY